MAAVCLAFLLAGSNTARALVLDWNSATWAPGSLSNSYDLTGDAVSDITVAWTSQNVGVWTNDPTSGLLTPTIDNTKTGGFGPTQMSLNVAANLHTNSRVTCQLSFTGGSGWMAGAANVSFTLFDLDLTADRDEITNIYGVAPDGTHIAATITNVGSNVVQSGTGLGVTLTGQAANLDDSSNGNATISFGSTIITDVFFTFGNSSGPPRFQDLGIGGISFSPVPEINPAATSAVSCALAVGLTVFAQRRARQKLRRSREAQS